jgi:hypothetical protein
VDAIGDRVRAAVSAQRDQAPAGDERAAIANLAAHYDDVGDLMLHLLAQEERVPPFKAVAERALRRAQLVAACDIQVWKVLRRDLGLDRHDYERAVGALIATRS